MTVSGKLSRLFRRRSSTGRQYQSQEAEAGTTTRRTEITVETQRVFRISRQSASVHDWCEGCGETVELMSLESAAALAAVPAQAIHQLVEADRVHTSYQSNTQFVCFQSLRTAIAEIIMERENGNEA